MLGDACDVGAFGTLAAKCGPGTPHGDQDVLREIARPLAMGFMARGDSLREAGVVTQDARQGYRVGFGQSGVDSLPAVGNISEIGANRKTPPGSPRAASVEGPIRYGSQPLFPPQKLNTAFAAQKRPRGLCVPWT